MGNNKCYSNDLKRWYWPDIYCILDELKDGKQAYTHHFEFTLSNGKRNYAFVGKSNRYHLRKCLWTLECDGLIENINIGFNIHQWKITEKGLNYFNNLNQTQ